MILMNSDLQNFSASSSDMPIPFRNSPYCWRPQCLRWWCRRSDECSCCIHSGNDVFDSWQTTTTTTTTCSYETTTTTNSYDTTTRKVGLCSCDQMSDRWLWHHDTIWSRTWSRRQSPIVHKVKVFIRPLTTARSLFVSLTLMLVTSLLPPQPPSRPACILLLQTTRWENAESLTLYSLQTAGRTILQPYSVLVNDCDQEF